MDIVINTFSFSMVNGRVCKLNSLLRPPTIVCLITCISHFAIYTKSLRVPYPTFGHKCQIIFPESYQFYPNILVISPNLSSTTCFFGCRVAVTTERMARIRTDTTAYLCPALHHSQQSITLFFT